MFAPRYFAHANVNTADLEGAESFYTEVIGLRPVGHTEPELPQDGGPYALPGQQVRWRGAFLADERRLRGPIVDLLQWLEPPTAPSLAEAAGRPSGPGLVGLGFAVGDLGVTAAALARRGLPRRVSVLRRDGVVADEVIVTADHDGTRLTLRAARPAPRYECIQVASSDLARSVAFYEDVLKLVTEPVATWAIELDGAVTESGTSVRAYLPGQRDKFWLELLRIDGSDGRAPARRGHDAGLYRMALLVDDVHDAHRDLVKRLPDAAAPVHAELGGGHRAVPAVFFTDPDGTVIEFLEGVLT